MKKVLKLTRTVLFILILAFVAGIILHQLFIVIEKKQNPSIGQYVDIDGKKMSLYSIGSGEHTIIMLPGLGTTSPILDFMPLAEELSKDNHVVIVEPFGYGWSDITSKERTIKNEVTEIHAALKAADIQGPYILMPHSISGLHSIYYANTYPDEVSGIIGIDCTLPRMPEYFEEDIPSKMPSAVGQLANLGVMRLLTLIAPDNFISDNSKGFYSDENLALQRHISSWKANNSNMIDQMNHISDSIAKTHDMTFSSDLPLLFFTTDENDKTPRADGKTNVSFYESYLTNPSIQKVIPLNGSHYLHWSCKDEMCKQIKIMLNS